MEVETEAGETSQSLLRPVELKFNVPWGHIAAKAWGDPHGKPVLAVHGKQDNAAVFDRLVPMLLQLVRHPLYIVSVDLPGHGLSSWMPPGIPYRFTDGYGSLRRVVTQLGWNKFYYIGHSLGGLFGYYFAASYPELIEKLILIDIISFKEQLRDFEPEMLRRYAEDIFTLETKQMKNNVPLYTLKDALQKLARGRNTEMTENGIRALASRSLLPVDKNVKMFKFSGDPRVKYINFPIIIGEEGTEIANDVKCPLLLVTGNKSDMTPHHPINEAMLNAFSNNSAYFKHYIVEGDHDIHLNFPERIVHILAKFLNEPMSLL